MLQARYGSFCPCARHGACGGIAVPGSIYCESCREERGRRRAREGEDAVDLEEATLMERLGGDGPWLKRVRTVGTQKCAWPDCVRACLPGRRYCGSKCRRRVQVEGPPAITINGVKAPLLVHARRVGILPGTVYKRLRLGMTAEEAITTPLDQEMRRRSA